MLSQVSASKSAWVRVKERTRSLMAWLNAATLSVDLAVRVTMPWTTASMLLTR